MKTDFCHLTFALCVLLLSLSSCREGYDVPFYIGCLEDAEPYSYRDSNGEITGLEVDMIQAAADYYGIRVSFIPTSYEDIYNQLQKRHHKIDGAAAMIPWTNDRMESFTFVVPSYMTTSFCLAVPDGGRSVGSFDDLSGKRLAVKSGSLAEGYALDHCYDWECTVVAFDSFREEMDSVMEGNADALLEDKFLVEYYIGHYSAPLLIRNDGVPNIVYGFVTGKNQDKTLRRDIQAGLEGIFANGTAEKIISRYRK